MLNCPAIAAENAPTRVINVVYDDSGSMYENNRVGNVAWSQAKYSAEVFAALLGSTDRMNIYLMSDFVQYPPVRTPRLQLHGRNGSALNVKEIHNMTTQRASGTPFEPVQQAHDDLVKENADEKWLVILTDGEFNNMKNTAVDAFFRSKSPDVKVYFIAFGDDAASITQDAANNVFFEHARNGPELLEKITNMSTRIFNFNKLRVDPRTLHFEFDIPMYALTVFAQGQNVSINGIIDSSGNRIGSSPPVHVQYSTQPALNYAGAPYDTSLNGLIAEFSNKFPPGNYTLSVDNADTIEIYYKPDVEIDVFMTDENGQEVTSDKLEGGEYTLNFCFVKSGTKERLPHSELLGEITYTARIISNGVMRDREYTQGDRIELEEGSHFIDAQAVYLEYFTVSTELVLNIYQNKDIALAPGQAGEISYTLTEYGFDRDEPFGIKAQIDGRDFTAGEWSALGMPVVESDNGFLSFRTAKGGVGEFLVYPVFSGETREDAESAMGRHSLRMQVNKTAVGDESWTGAGAFTVRVDSGYLDVRYAPVDVPTYEIDRNGIANADRPMLIMASVDGRDITADEWALMRELPTVTAADGNIGEFLVEKTAAPGQYALYPTLFQDSLSKTDAVNSELMFSYNERIGNEVWSGDGLGEGGLALRMSDSRSWLERNLERLIRWAIIGLVLLLILGYIPPFKKYLPRGLKPRPMINCTLRRPGPRPSPQKGALTKYLSTRLIPYKAEKGRIRFMPKGTSGAAPMEVKADARNTMYITNVKAYAGKDHITFNGDSIQKGTNKPKIVSAGVLIEVRTDTLTYACQPNI